MSNTLERLNIKMESYICKYQYNTRMQKFILPIFLIISSLAWSQADTSKSTLSLTGYLEVYYLYDFNQPTDHTRPPFIYSFDRHNEFNLNLGFVKAAYLTEKVRANIAVGMGTYMNANYASEPGVLKNVFESNVGVKLSKKKNIWLDAGIFSSHIGFESAVSKDCWSLTRSMLADNSPYYESGVKATFINDSSTWLASVLVLNGWQHIQRPDGNNLPAFGTQVTYTPNSKITMNSSTFIGSEKPDTAMQMRYFHNFYGMFHLTKKIHLTAGFDFGLEQKGEGSKEYNTWYSPVLIVKLLFNDKWSLAGRGEFYCDKNGVIIYTGTTNGFQTMGYSLNVDYQIRENAVWRLEGRMLNSKDAVFTKNNALNRSNSFVTTSLAVSF